MGKGRPSVFNRSQIAQARELKLQGWSDARVIEALSVSPATYYRHKPDLHLQEIRIGVDDFLLQNKSAYLSEARGGRPLFYDLAFAKYFCAHHNLVPNFVFAPFGELFAGVNAGKFDVALGFAGNHQSRRNLVEFSSPYMLNSLRQGCLAARAGCNIRTENTSTWAGKRIAVIRGSMHEEFAKKISKQFTFTWRAYKSAASCFTAFSQKWVDAIFQTEMDFLLPRSLPAGLRVLPGQVHFNVKTCVILNRHNEQLAERMETFIGSAFKNGVLEEMAKQYALI